LKQKLLLVDYENVQQVDLALLDENFFVVIFVGSNQKNIPIDLVANAQKLGGRVEWQRVEGVGKNALDFHIACHLGRMIEKSPNLYCIVLSNDKGFDPLLQHLNKNGMQCVRITDLIDLNPKTVTANKTKVIKDKPATAPAKVSKPKPVKANKPKPVIANATNYNRVVELLKKSEDKSRPHKRATLSHHISSMFQKNIVQNEVDKIIKLLVKNKIISENNNTISYTF